MLEPKRLQGDKVAYHHCTMLLNADLMVHLLHEQIFIIYDSKALHAALTPRNIPGIQNRGTDSVRCILFAILYLRHRHAYDVCRSRVTNLQRFEPAATFDVVIDAIAGTFHKHVQNGAGLK